RIENKKILLDTAFLTIYTILFIGYIQNAIFYKLFLPLGMPNLPTSFSSKLQQRQQNSSLRKLPQPNGLIDFSSNAYLGLANDEALFEAVHLFLSKQKISQNG